MLQRAIQSSILAILFIGLIGCAGMDSHDYDYSGKSGQNFTAYNNVQSRRLAPPVTEAIQPSDTTNSNSRMPASTNGTNNQDCEKNCKK